jgi:hypothetical protein
VKKILIAIGVLVWTQASAQEMHTDSTLKLMSKDQLVVAYQQQVNQLVKKLPYSVWGLNAEDKPLPLPKSKYIANKKVAMSEDTEVFVETNTEYMYEVVFYADTDRLINAVLYLQNINKQIFDVR